MKKIAISISALAALIATPVMAADMATKAPPVAPSAPAALSWTGYYIGGNIGYAWGDDPKSTSGTTVLGGFPLNPGSATIHPDGGFSGLQSGYNWQIAPAWLVGFESDFQYGRIKGSGNCISACGTQPPFLFINYNSFNVTDRLNWFGTVRGRVGYISGPALFYVTGGLAYGEVERQATIAGFNTIPGFGGFAGSYDNTTTRAGWTLGGGIEARLSNWWPTWNGWTAKVEYLYIDLGHFNDTLNELYLNGAPGAVRTISGDIRESIVRFGLNYQFH